MTQQEFQKLFYAYFFFINAEVEAVYKLEETIYYQGSYRIKDHLDEFQTLISDDNYNNPYPIVVKFRKGLQVAIQNQIAILLVGYSEDTNLTAYFEAARYIDQAL